MDSALYLDKSSFPTLAVLAWRAVHKNDLKEYEIAVQALISCLKPTDEDLMVPSEPQPPLLRMDFRDNMLVYDRWNSNLGRYEMCAEISGP